MSEGQESIDRRAWSRPRQWRVVLIGAAVALVVVLASWAAARFFAKQPEPPAAAAASPGTFKPTAQQLKTFTVEPVQVFGFVSEEVTEGKIAVNGDRSTPLYSPFSGRVTRVIASWGDAVKAGAPLATLDASEFVQSQNDLSTAASQVKLAKINETRKHALFDAKGGSLQDWQQSQADLTSAETGLAAARNRLKIFGKSDAEIDALQNSHGMTATATLKAPITGIVIDRQLGPGQYVQAGGATPVFTIADPSNVWLLANVREADAGLVHVGQAMEAHVPAYPKRVFNARVTYVAALVDPNTHRLPVRAEIDNRDGALKPEMFASFRILTSEASDAPAVPETAVVYEGEAAHVWVVSDDGVLAYRSIRTGRNNGGLVEVLNGLKAGERIVTKGALFIDQTAAPAAT